MDQKVFAVLYFYAKRALARGDDKADLVYYARLAVIKAQLSLVSPEAGTPTATMESSQIVDRDL